MSVSRDTSGASMLAVMVAVAVGALALLFIQMNTTLISTTGGKVRGSRFSVALDSALDTMLLAYRLAEIRYNEQVGLCASDDARPFLTALKSGHGCNAGVGAVQVFGNADATTASTPVAPLYSYVQPGGCVIGRDTGIVCAGKPLPATLITLGMTLATEFAQRIDGATYQFGMNAVIPAKQIAELGVTITPATGLATRRGFAIRASLPNSAHLEYDGRVTQETPDPLSRCPSDPWATFRMYDPPTHKCQLFQQIGGGTGLAYFNGRFFGFRPGDGQVVDLLAASTSPGYLVDENTGATCAGCPRVFPSYSKVALRNTDDISVIDSQVFYVTGQGRGAELGALSVDGSVQPVPAPLPASPPGTPTRVPLCPLGKLGWSQAYVGIGASDWSDTILPTDPAASHRAIGTFFLKTDTSGMLTVTVLSDKGKKGPFGANRCLNFKFKGLDYWSCCVVFKDPSVQAPEYYRTYGFERTSDGKAYYLY